MRRDDGKRTHGEARLYLHHGERSERELYTGVTSDLVRRAHEHRTDAMEGFTRRYGCKNLVWFEVHDRIDDAIGREKRIKEWRRGWKLDLIEASNPEWEDLFPSLI